MEKVDFGAEEFRARREKVIEAIGDRAVAVVQGTDEAKCELVLKAINTGAEPVTATLDLQGVQRADSQAEMIVLRSDNPQDNNTLAEPTKVAPRCRPRRDAGNAGPARVSAVFADDTTHEDEVTDKGVPACSTERGEASGHLSMAGCVRRVGADQES